MNAPAAIAAVLVDIRNVGVHKSLKLTIHVPEEQALAAIAAFGWPTGVNPVPIAIARLVDEKEVVPTDRKSTNNPTDTPPRQQKETAGGAKKDWHDMPLAQQAGILCDEPPFLRFLNETYTQSIWTDAAQAVRWLCGDLESRKDLKRGTPAGDKWANMVGKYRTWQKFPELVS